MPKHPFFPTKPQPFATFENGSHSFLRPGQTLALKEAIGAAREPGGMGFNLGVQGVPVSLEKIMAFNTNGQNVDFPCPFRSFLIGG